MRQEKQLFFLLFVTYLVLVALMTWWDYVRDRELAVTKTDRTLFAAANALDTILGRDFHDTYTPEHPLPDARYRELVDRLGRLARRLDIAYVYTMARREGRVHFVVSNETAEDVARGTFSRFYNPYPDPPRDLLTALERFEPVYFTTYTNTWDSFRSVFIPMRTPQGFTYVLAADVKAERIDRLFQNALLHAALFGLLLLLPVIPLFFSYRHLQRRREVELIDQLYLDRLTGLPNRSRLIRDIEGVTSEQMGLMIFDIDNFKEINDLFGNAMGDRLLQEISTYLGGALSDGERLYRIHGDNYAILTPAADADALMRKATHYVRLIAEHEFLLQDEQVALTLSAGISNDDKASLLASASYAKSVAKQANLSIFYFDHNFKAEQSYQENFVWLGKLKAALREDRVVPYFQPILNNATGKIEKYEALVRLIDTDGTVISPARFLPVAKRSKLYKTLTRVVIRKSFERFADASLQVTINIGAEDLRDAELVNYLISQYHAFGMHGRVGVEIVETESVLGGDESIRAIAQLHEEGIRVFIDDFGSGYSNLDYLIKIRPHAIKIDGSLIEQILIDENAVIVVRAIVSFAKEMGLPVIAEYVYCAEVKSKVTAMGITYSQGYHIGAPSPDLTL